MFVATNTINRKYPHLFFVIKNKSKAQYNIHAANVDLIAEIMLKWKLVEQKNIRKNKNLNVKAVTSGTICYAAKLVIFSIAASIPALLLKNTLSHFFESKGRLLGFGSLVALSALAFAIVGIALLVITKDEIVKIIIRKIKK